MTIKEVSKMYDISQDTLRYYEKIGIIPPVARTKGGIRNYSDEDIEWIKNAKCMRSAGLSVDAIIEYVRLFKEGNDTINDRLNLLKNQREILENNVKKIEETLNLLNWKIDKYEKAVITGKLDWNEE
ncbi:MAG: MerR family transcriptional regulator [Lachnospirales bacterium]